MGERASAIAVVACLTACGRIDFDPRADAAQEPAVFAYIIAQNGLVMPQPDPTTIAVAAFDPMSGVVTELPAFDLGVEPFALVSHGPTLYASSKATGSIYTLQIDPTTGALAQIGQVLAAPFPISMTIDPSGRWLYAADEGNPRVWGYAIGPDATLSPIAGSPWTFAGTSCDFVAIDPSEQWMYAVDDGDEDLFGFSLQPDGSLVAHPALVWPTGDSDPHAAVFDHSGRHGFIAPDLAGGIPGFTLDAATGALSTTPGSKFASGGNTNEFAALSPTDDLLFMPFEGAPLSLNTFVIAGDGSLAHAPGSPLLVPNGSIGVAASPLGRYAVFTDGAGLIVISADPVAGITLVGMQALASMQRPYAVALVRAR